MKQKLIIIGAGMAAGRALEHLFEDGGDAWDVTLFNGEPRGTYNRLMLSPVLSGEKTYEQIVTHDADWYEAHGVTTRFGEHVVAIDREAQQVTGQSGDVLSYDKLLIATGSAPFIIPVEGRDLPGVVTYRDLEDTNAMIDAAAKGGRAVVIGGGLLGLEAAAGLRMRGMEVTVLHLMGHLMERQLDETAGGLLRKALEDRGIEVICRASTAAILGKDRVEGIMLEDGTGIEADLVVMAVGIRPETRLANGAGIEVERGIVVNDQMVTSDPDILALGECVEHRGQLFGLVAPLYDQAKVVAKTLRGEAAAFVPKEVATKLKVTGCDLFSAGDFAEGETREDIVFHDPTRGAYRRLVLEDSRLVGAVFYGDTNDSSWYFNLIRQGANIDDMRATLIFGPSYNEGEPLNPMVAAAALPGDLMVARCSGTPFAATETRI